MIARAIQQGGYEYGQGPAEAIQAALKRRGLDGKAGTLYYRIKETVDGIAGPSPLAATLAIAEGILVNEVEHAAPDAKPEVFAWYFDGADAPDLPVLVGLDVTRGGQVAAIAAADGPGGSGQEDVALPVLSGSAAEGG